MDNENEIPKKMKLYLIKFMLLNMIEIKKELGGFSLFRATWICTSSQATFYLLLKEGKRKREGENKRKCACD